MSRTCPKCGADNVLSRTEWVQVYNHRHQIRENPRRLARFLETYQLYPEPHEDAEEFCRRWARGDAGGPELICANCVTPQKRREVPS